MSEQGVQEGTEHAPLRGPGVEDQHVLLPTLTPWGRPVRKARIELQREVFSRRGPSLMMSLEGKMVLNTELLSINSILSYFPSCPGGKGPCEVQLTLHYLWICWGSM